MTTHFKTQRIKSKKLTDSAKGERCTLNTRFCNNDSSTVVACHAPSDTKGMGIKSDDFWIAFGCSSCHDYLDGRRNVKPSEEETLFYWYRGIHRTLKRQFSKGVIK